jgi:sigma-B regulation protein RsbU (phosphoserine phosphatase)
MFVTLFLGFLDIRSGLLTYVNAGHPMPHHLRGSGLVEQIEGKPQVPLAVRSTCAYEDQTLSLRPGDAIFACTDGVAEAMNARDEFYGESRLEENLLGACKLEPKDIVHTVKGSVDSFTGEAPKADDVTILALRWRPL